MLCYMFGEGKEGVKVGDPGSSDFLSAHWFVVRNRIRTRGIRRGCEDITHLVCASVCVFVCVCICVRAWLPPSSRLVAAAEAAALVKV